MSVQMILLPLFAQVLLTFVLIFSLAIRRQVALRTGKTRWQDISLRESNWPKSAMQNSYAFSNQFELPVLFCVLTILALVTKQADLLFVVMAWIFVVSRILHAYIHVTSNYVPMRGLSFAAGCATLFLMWVIYIVRVLTLPWP
jgi:hypothetical protein